MTGHLLVIRKARENMSVFNYARCRGRCAADYATEYRGTGFVAIRSKYVLRKLAEESPLFRPIWEDLKVITSDECGIYLAESPDAGWLASIQLNEKRLFEAFSIRFDPEMFGVESADATDEARAFLAAALLAIKLGQTSKVEVLFQDLISQFPAYISAWMCYMCFLLEQGEPESAYEVLKRASVKYPDCLLLDRVGTECCLKLRNLSQAEWHLNRLCGSNPWDPFAMAGLANVAYLKGEFAVAVKLYEECLEHGVKGALAPTVYARALCYSRRFEDALAVFHELNSTNGSSATTLNDIGMTLVMLGRPREALDYGLRALDLDPMYRFAWDTVGFAHLKMGQYGESITKFLKAIELEPNYPDAWRHLLHAYHGAGQTQELIGARAWVGDLLPKELARFEKEKGTELLD